MPYSAIPNRVVPYHLDGSVVKIINASTGVIKSLTADEAKELNDTDYVIVSFTSGTHYCVVFFPELRDISAIYCVTKGVNGFHFQMAALQGSADTTNGLDGTWTDATLPDGYPYSPSGDAAIEFDAWRKGIKACSGLNGVKAIRFMSASTGYFNAIYVLHIYGRKTSGQTADDILFLDAQNSDAEFTAPLDFGDRPAGTSYIRQIKVQNSSATKTANNVVVTVEDTADIVRVSDNSAGPWVLTQTFTSLAAAAKSAVIYVKCEPPAPPTPLGPMRAPIKVTVGSWT